jgi:hypothetical protein
MAGLARGLGLLACGMALHLIKLAVGIETVEQLHDRQAGRIREAQCGSGEGRLRILTRNMPRRSGEVLAGGSLYWVIKGQVCVRQSIIAIEAITEQEANRRCAIYLDTALVRTHLRRSRPFQGWRYFEADLAPPDLSGPYDPANEPPAEMAAELRELGLL